MSSVSARLAASKSVLAAMANTPAHERVSKAECDNLMKLWASSDLSTLEIAGLCTEVKTCGFTKGDEHQLLEALADHVVRAHDPAATRTADATTVIQPPLNPRENPQLQNYEDGVRYVPPAMWDKAAETGNTDEIFNLYGCLGLRHFTEGTMHVLGLAILCVTEGEEETKMMSPAARTQYIKGLKVNNRRLAKTLPPPAAYLLKLPPWPAELQVSHPELFNAAVPMYMRDSLGENWCPVSADVLSELQNGTKMRLHGSNSKACRHQGSFQELPMSVPMLLKQTLEHFTRLACSGNMPAVSGPGNAVNIELLQPQSQQQRRQPSMLGLMDRGMQRLVQQPLQEQQKQQQQQQQQQQQLQHMEKLEPPPLERMLTPPTLDAQDQVGPCTASCILPERKVGHKLSVHEATAQLLSKKRPRESDAGEPAKKGLGKGSGKKKGKEKGKKGSGKGSGKGSAAGEPAKKGSGKSSTKGKGEEKVSVNYGHEATRQQYVCRCTGVPSKTFSYAKGFSKRQAETEAKQWCLQKCTEFKIPAAAKFR